MPLPDLSTNLLLHRDPRGHTLSTYRIRLLSELTDALETQIQTLMTHGLPAASRHAAAVLLLAERLRGVQLLWEVLLLQHCRHRDRHCHSRRRQSAPFAPSPAEMTIGSMSARDTCASLVRAAVLESEAVYPPGSSSSGVGCGAALSFKTGVVDALVDARRSWSEALQDRVAAGFFDLDVDVGDDDDDDECDDGY